MNRDQGAFEASGFSLRERILRLFLMLLFRGVFGLCQLLYRLEISMEAPIPATGPYIFVSNHSSKLDFLPIIFLKQIRPDAFIYGAGAARAWMASAKKVLGGVTTYKGLGRSAPLLWIALKALQNGRPIGIAPEGETEWDGRLLPFKPGVAWLALHSRAAIVPCVLKGGYAIWPRWARYPRLTGRLQLRLGGPFMIPPAADGRVTDDMIEAVNRRIADELIRLAAKP